MTSFSLHILAMSAMLLDHLWATIFPYHEWMTCVGRIAFPIFAFMITEGFFHTSDIRKYMLRLLAFAVISEIPFDLVYASSVVFPYHQNVMWTFLISVVLMQGMEKIRQKGKPVLTVLGCSALTILGAFLGTVTMVDYFGVGVLTVLLFYFLHGREWWKLAGQLVGMWYLHWKMLGGYYYDVDLLGHTFELVQQGLAMLALIPIWFYQGKQGYHSKWFQYFCYAFYPLHLLVLYIIWNHVN